MTAVIVEHIAGGIEKLDIHLIEVGGIDIPEAGTVESDIFYLESSVAKRGRGNRTSSLKCRGW